MENSDAFWGESSGWIEDIISILYIRFYILNSNQMRDSANEISARSDVYVVFSCLLFIKNVFMQKLKQR